MNSNSKFVDKKTRNCAKNLSASGTSSNQIRSHEMTKIKIINHNVNSALSSSNNKNNNNHNNIDNKEHSILSTNNHLSRHSIIIPENKNSMLHRYILVYNYIIIF